MKNPDRETVANLDALPNIGKSISMDLASIGIMNPQQLVGADPFDLYDRLCDQKSAAVDPCVIDVFMSAIAFMEGEVSKTMVEIHSKTKNDCWQEFQ
jgi:hypothetical protein